MAEATFSADGEILRILSQDPPPDPQAPAETHACAIPSGGINLNGVLYVAAGRGPHPTILLLHGLPGNEQNLDLAQSMRRAGWNVLTLHYRGSWGTPGRFSFDHCMEDGTAAVAWLRHEGGKGAYRLGHETIVVIGHSMGGFVAADVVASDPTLAGAGLISGVAIGPEFGALAAPEAAAIIDEHVGASDGLHILAGASPSRLAAEASDQAQEWSLERLAPDLADRPLLLVTSDDGFAPGTAGFIRIVGRHPNHRLRTAHIPTDHSYSDHRIALQTEVLSWLGGLDGVVPASAGTGAL